MAVPYIFLEEPWGICSHIKVPWYCLDTFGYTLFSGDVVTLTQISRLSNISLTRTNSDS